MEESKKSNKGGKREGAGRPFAKERKKFVTISVTGTPGEIQEIRQRVSKSGKSISRYILDKILYVDQ